MQDRFQKVAFGAALLVSAAALVRIVVASRASIPVDPPPEIPIQSPSGVGEGRVAPLFRESFASLISPETIEPPPVVKKTEPDVSERFRLVTVSLAADPTLSMAFIENRAAGTQKCYHAGDIVEEGVSVVEILDAGVVIATSRGTFLLTFGSATSLRDGNSAAVGPAAAGDAAATLQKFGGRRTGTNEWHFSRAAVMDYYEELKSRPERLVAVFDTMAPIYNSEREIEGYKVDIQGEAEFFKAIGFNQGDIVREVNGIPMTNRRAAENLIRRYADDDLDFIVIKMERDGKPVQQVYHSK